MKNSFVTFLLFVLISCNSGNEKENEIVVSDSLTQTVNLHIDLIPPTKPVSELDTFLYHFTKENLKPGKHLLNVRYKYNVQRDTLVYNKLDSIIIYKYPIDSIAKYYCFPYSWTKVFQERVKDEVKKNLKELVSLLSKATYCQGIIYSDGDQMVEVFSFSNVEQAKRAKQLFDGAQDYVFPKTLSFAAQRMDKLYVFHARYTGPSWQSKKDFEKFEKLK